MHKQPTHVITETFIIKDLALTMVSSLSQIRLCDVQKIFNNLDDRLNTNKTSIYKLSRQICDAYFIYLKYLPIINQNQYAKYSR